MRSPKLVVGAGPDELAEAAASLVRARVEAKRDLVMAVPAGRTPRPMYALIQGPVCAHPASELYDPRRSRGFTDSGDSVPQDP